MTLGIDQMLQTGERSSRYKLLSAATTSRSGCEVTARGKGTLYEVTQDFNMGKERLEMPVIQSRRRSMDRAG
jgi:hypothetical protein